MLMRGAEPEARRNITLLFGAQALGASIAPIVIAVGGLVGQALSQDPELVTLPVSLYGVGVALAMIPVALLMKHMGRKATYLMGAVVSILAASLAAYAIIGQSFILFCLAMTLAGIYGACVQNYRFAASDMVPAALKPNAISLIMIGGLVAAIVGPQLVIQTIDVIDGAPFAGSFIGQAALALLALPLLLLLRIPDARETDSSETSRSFAEIAKNPVFLVAILSGVVSYGLMAFVMTAAPIAMVHEGHSADDATLGIQWHILAMFAPSFITGRLINWIGVRTVTAIGIMLLFTSGLAAISGLAILHFWSALILLGLGWNFGFIGATSLLTSTYRSSEQAKVQALNDFLVFGSVAIASLAAGQQLSWVGWHQLNMMTFPLIAVVLLALAFLPWLEKVHQHSKAA